MAAIVWTTVVAIGCERSDSPGVIPPHPVVVAVNPALASFAGRLGEGIVQVESPRSSEFAGTRGRPDAETIARVQRSELILLQGEAVEPWGASIPVPRSRSVNTTANARSRFPTARETIVHRHGEGPAHTHGRDANHAWLDLGIARLQARSVRDALVEIRPESEALIDERWRALDRDLAALQQRTREVLEGVSTILATGPEFEFLTHGQGLSMELVDPTDAGLATAADLDDLPTRDRSDGVTLLLVDAEPDPAVAAKLVESGVTPVLFETIEFPDPANRGFVERMRANLDRLAKARRTGEDVADKAASD